MERRPINLNLFTIHFPIPSIVSILHRLSGVFVFLLIPGLLWVLQQSLSSQTDFQILHDNLNHPFIKFGLWCFLLAFGFHVIAGVRHLLMDVGFAESKEAGRKTAWMVIVLISILTLIITVWLLRK